MVKILISVATMGILGAFFAYLLSIAQRVFKVDEDPRISEVDEVLPGANCGACGFAGCHALAEAIVKGEAEVAACPVGGG